MNRVSYEDLHTLLTVKVSARTNYRLILFDNHIPMPSDIKEYTSQNGGYNILTWRINGAFNTLQNKEYYNDTKEKLILLLNAYDAVAEHLLNGITSNQNCFVAIHNKYKKHQEIYSLKDFKHMEDLRLGRTKIIFPKNSKMSVFKRVRITAYNLVEEGNLSIERLDEAVMRYSDNYSNDAYMAKAIYKWIVHKIEVGEYYASKSIKKITMTRKENAVLQSKSVFKRNFESFKNYINFVGLKTKSVAELSKILNLSRPTIYKFIKIFLNLKLVNSIRIIGGVAERVSNTAKAMSANVNNFNTQTTVNRDMSILYFNLNFNYDTILNNKLLLKELSWREYLYPKIRKEILFKIGSMVNIPIIINSLKNMEFQCHPVKRLF